MVNESPERVFYEVCAKVDGPQGTDPVNVSVTKGVILNLVDIAGPHEYPAGAVALTHLDFHTHT